MQTYQLYINGEFVDSASGRFIDVHDPANGAVFARVPECTTGEVQQAVAAAKAAQAGWAALPAIERGAALQRLAAQLRAHAEQIGTVLTREQGKPLAEGIGEPTWGADLMDYHAGWARRIEGEIIQSDAPDENILLYKVPIGVVACILPWNFPIYVLIRKIAPALITGNTVVLKPSSETPCSAFELARAVEAAGLPAGVINIISGRGSIVGDALTSDPDVDMVTVTGSTAAGQQIMRQCAENITRVSLELGGKAPAVVMDDADLELAVRCIKGGRLANAGQVCNCVERVYVHEAVAAEFTARMVAAMAEVRLGPGTDEPDMGPLVSEQARASVHGFVERAVGAGATLECGGKAPAQLAQGAFYEPTVLSGCRQEMEIMREEVFGPVLPIVTFSSVDEALALANDSRYGLTATLYTRDYHTVMRFANAIEAGELYVNRQQGEAYQGYHAGWKLSGIGGDDGRHGMEAFLKTRVVYLSY
jgi:lactaldehyde dehydrogenase/glycolaldehyde dehydrogenase